MSGDAEERNVEDQSPAAAQPGAEPEAGAESESDGGYFAENEGYQLQGDDGVDRW